MTSYSQKNPWRRAGLTLTGRLLAGLALGWGIRLGWAGLATPETGNSAGGAGSAAGVTVTTARGAADGPDAGALFPAGSTPFQQMTRALTAGDGLSAGEIRRLLEQPGRFPGNGAGEIAKAALLRRWLALEPEAALRYCREHEEGLLPRLLGNYAVEHPEEAERSIRSLLPEDSEARAVPYGEISVKEGAWAELARAALLKSADAAREVIHRASRAQNWKFQGGGAMVPVLIRMAGAEDAATFAARAAELPPRLRGAARSVQCAEQVEREGLAGWKKWVTEHEEDDDGLRETAWETLLGTDLSAAFTLLGEADEETARDLSERVMGTPGVADKAEALRGAAQMPQPTREALARRILSSCEPEDLESVNALLPLTGEGLKPSDFTMLMRAWAENDPERGREWVESLPEGPAREAARECLEKERKSAEADREREEHSDTRSEKMLAAWDTGTPIRPPLSKLAGLDTAGLEEALREGYTREGTLAETLAQENPAAGAAWLAGRDTESRTGRETAARFAAEWARRDPAAAAAWAESLPEGTLGPNAVYNVAREYARYAPGRAEAWAAALPSGAMRDAAAKGLAER